MCRILFAKALRIPGFEGGGRLPLGVQTVSPWTPLAELLSLCAQSSWRKQDFLRWRTASLGAPQTFSAGSLPGGSGENLALGSWWPVSGKYHPEFPERGRKQRRLTSETRGRGMRSLLPAHDGEQSDPRWVHPDQLRGCTVS